MLYTFRRIIQPLNRRWTIRATLAISCFAIVYQALFILNETTDLFMLHLLFQCLVGSSLFYVWRQDKAYQMAFYSYYLLLFTLLIGVAVIVAIAAHTLLSQLIRPLFIPYVLLSGLLFYTCLHIEGQEESNG